MLARVIDAAGHETVYEADPMGRVTSIVTADGARQTFRYDSGGRLIEVTDPNQRSTRYEINARGLLLSRTDAAGRAVGFGYDEAFRLASLTNENRESYRFRYDRRDQLIEEMGLDGTRRRTLTMYADSVSLGGGRPRDDVRARRAWAARAQGGRARGLRYL